MATVPPSLASASASPSLAASRSRRQRSNAISRARESEAEWDTMVTSSLADAPVSPTATSAPCPPPWRDDELVCPLAPEPRRAHTDPYAHVSPQASANANVPSWVPVHVWPADQGELQAMLEQFVFPTFPGSGRKHRRSGEIVIDNPPSPVAVGTATLAVAVSSGKKHTTSGPIRRTWCAHCERGRS